MTGQRPYGGHVTRLGSHLLHPANGRMPGGVPARFGLFDFPVKKEN